MEQIILTAATASQGRGHSVKLKRLWIGQEEVEPGQRSVEQWLAEMSQQGWHVVRSRATPDPSGIVCEYFCQRPVSSL
jgi:hypothetical protein